ncbi:hypothetical protein TPA4_40 [Tsukamurella phage TPA4]|nr:hypothetical protein BH784_gp40 [Tsukamurella phage TPA4]AKJ72205.1 hypothetical protein TPA4_40 [Tsukamurella phage TPA4]
MGALPCSWGMVYLHSWSVRAGRRWGVGRLSAFLDSWSCVDGVQSVPC